MVNILVALATFLVFIIHFSLQRAKFWQYSLLFYKMLSKKADGYIGNEANEKTTQNFKKVSKITKTNIVVSPKEKSSIDYKTLKIYRSVRDYISRFIR